MAQLDQVAAMDDGGIVTNVAALDSDVDYTDWLKAVKLEHDSVLLVPEAGIGWEEYKKGKVRMPQPSPDCSWDDKAAVWICPEPEETA